MINNFNGRLLYDVYVHDKKKIEIKETEHTETHV